jgi:hypothetical protein
VGGAGGRSCERASPIAAHDGADDKTQLFDDETRWFKKEIATYLDAANQAVDDVLTRQARVHLLFGDESLPGIAATGVTSQLRNMLLALEQGPESIRDHETMSMYSRNFTGTVEQHETFNRAARAALTETWWEWLRGHLPSRKPPA